MSHSFWMTVYVHGIPANKACSRNTEVRRKLNCKTGRSGHRSHDGNSRDCRLLRDLKTQPATDDKHEGAGIGALTQCCTQNLIHSIVPAQILANQNQFSKWIEQCGGVNSTGAAEVWLR